MVATLEWLESYGSAQLAISCVIEGFGTVFATDAMPNTYSADTLPYNNWNDPTGGLHLDGTISAAIKLYAQDLNPSDIDIDVTDPTGAVLQLLRVAYSDGHITYLTQSVEAGSIADIHVQSTGHWANSGTLWIGGEAIQYTGKTATTFTGITRALWVANMCDDGTAFAPSHNIGNNVTLSATTSPAVTDYPRTTIGRFIHLYLHVKNPLTGVYNLPSLALKFWSGRVKMLSDNGDGSVRIAATSADDLMQKIIGQEQWTGHANEGRFFTTGDDALKVAVAKSNGAGYSSVYAPLADLTALSDDTYKTHDEVANAINAQFEAWRSGSTTDAGDLFQFALVDTGDGGPPRYRISLDANTVGLPTGSYAEVLLGFGAWHTLGWTDNGDGSVLEAGNYLVKRTLTRVSDSRWELTAPKPPVIYVRFSRLPGTKVSLSKQIGTFYPQDASQIKGATPNVNGLVSIKGGENEGIFAVEYDAGGGGFGPSFRFVAELDQGTGSLIASQYNETGSSHDSSWDGYYRLGEASEPPIITQVWFETGPAGTLLLKALLSTGASGYNHATYDAYDWGGAGVPASLIDVHSWETLNDVRMQLLIKEPTPFYKYLEPILNASNRYLVSRPASNTTSPKLAIVRPTLDNAQVIDWQLTESNKCESPDRMRIQLGADGIINQVIVRYGQGSGKSTMTINATASQEDFGSRRAVEIDAPMVTNMLDIAPSAISPALAYCSRPLAIATRSYNATLLRMAPGDSVQVADNYAIDPQTGTRGVVVYGWVLSTQFDLMTGKGQVQIVFLPEKVSRCMMWGPSARIDEAAANFGYDVATKTLTTKPHEYSADVEANDNTWFLPGDPVQINSLDEASPLGWTDVIAAVGTNTLQLTTGLAGWNTSKRYVIEYNEISASTTAQRAKVAFIADDATLDTGASIKTPYDWGSDGTSNRLGELGATLTVDYDKGMFQPPTTSYVDQGFPASIHKQTHAVNACNNMLSYKTRNVYLNNFLQDAATQTGTTRKLVYLAWIPLYGHTAHDGGIRALQVQLRFKTSSGTGTFIVHSSPSLPTGTSFTSYSFPYGSHSATLTTTSASYEWAALTDLASAPSSAYGSQGLSGTWIAIEAAGSGGGVTASLDHVFICESSL